MSKRPLIHSVQQGECHLNSLDLVHRGPRFIHLRGDMEAKYAEIQGYSGNEVWIGAGERTLHRRSVEVANGTPNGWTVIRLNRPSGRWTVEAMISRYQLDIFAYTAKRGRQIWTNSDATSPRRQR